MKISTKGQYALEALIDLAMHSEDGQESLKNVAQRRGISEPYLDQIFNAMRKAGIVESVRGAQGGYRLARDAGMITAGEVIRSVEGSLSPVKCIDCNETDNNQCALRDRCVTRKLWAGVAAGIDSALDRVTLSDLVACCNPQPAEHTLEYSI